MPTGKGSDRRDRRERARKQRQQQLTALHRLESARADAQPLLARIARGVLDRYVTGERPRIVELGCGGGQLRRWMASRLRAGTLHVDAAEAFADLARRRDREAAVARADVTALPIADGALDAVVGLCVLDAVPGEAVRDEVRRVLRPGGCLVHLLDLTTNLAGLFTAMALEGLVPLPNFHGVPGLPDREPLDDLLVAPHEQLAAVVGLLERAGHPLAAELGGYLALFDPEDADGDEAARAFVAITGDPAAAARFSESLARLAVTLASDRWREAVPLALRPLSTSRHLEEKLRDLYGPAHGFDVEHAGAVSARDTVAPEAVPQGCAFLGVWVGTRARRADVPPTPAGRPLAELTGDPADGGGPDDAGDPVREAAVHVFVARRR